jgi:hypothetical protein
MCGWRQWANVVVEYLPVECVHAVVKVLELVPMLAGNWRSTLWLANNYEVYREAAEMVYRECPVFY